MSNAFFQINLQNQQDETVYYFVTNTTEPRSRNTLTGNRTVLSLTVPADKPLLVTRSYYSNTLPSAPTPLTFRVTNNENFNILVADMTALLLLPTKELRDKVADYGSYKDEPIESESDDKRYIALSKLEATLESTRVPTTYLIDEIRADLGPNDDFVEEKNPTDEPADIDWIIHMKETQSKKFYYLLLLNLEAEGVRNVDPSETITLETLDGAELHFFD